MTATSKLNPFDFVNDITFGKKDIFSDETQRAYIPFMVNRALSYFPDTVFYAHDMNLVHFLDKYVQYKYFLHAIPKRRRFAKWGRKINDEDVVSVSKVYQLSTEKAAELIKVLTPEQLNGIRDISNSLG
jgi:hypothetical protein